ncbi:MAG TPA: ABC transporter ATP-binding protein [Candidatus Baltobacteraceae bacterium]|jgi:iron complex transport system ATP-binding protein|nr:ABC transporter ATP-binding protein [Candidatus Baltobacteraceae bacterium]
MIELDDLTIGIDGRTLIKGVTANVASGEFIAILGSNGVGKTTLLRSICGLHPALRGAARIEGADISSLSARERAQRIAFVTADDALIDALSVREVVAMGRFPHHRWWEWNPLPGDERAVDDALRAVRMEDYGERLFSTLSTGERQRVWIAMGVSQEAPVLVLDEPTSHLDVRVAHEILVLLRGLSRRGTTVLCALHDLNDAAAYADRLMLLGCEELLAFGAPAAVLQPALVERAYGIAMEAITTPHGIRIFPKSAVF